MVGVIKRLSVNLPRDVLLEIYQSFIVAHLHYRDIIYDKPNNERFFLFTNIIVVLLIYNILIQVDLKTKLKIFNKKPALQ